MYKAYITALTNVRPHPNADRLLLGDCFGNTVCVSLEYREGDIGVYFPSDGQLSVEFCEKNNLVRKKNEQGVNVGGYLDPDKRNVTAIKLRGEKSDGLFLPLTALDYCYAHHDASVELHIGDVIDGAVNGQEICCKYIPRTNQHRGGAAAGNRTRKKKVDIAPLFREHADTEQLTYNLSAFKPGDEIEISLKLHGTSARTAYLPVLKGYKRTFWDRLCRREGKPVYDWDYVSGTRRVVLENYEGGFYGDNSFRKQHHDFFVGKLWKGECVYYEIVGFTDTGAPIMGNANNAKLNDKEFVKKYGKETVFSYGCSPDDYKTVLAIPEAVATTNNGESHTVFDVSIKERIPRSDIYVYRMTMTNEDGEVVEYSPDFMRYRCEQIGVKCVPVFGKGFISPDRLHFIELNGYDHDYLIGESADAGDMVRRCAEEYYDGADPIGKTHVREGVVVRIINRPKFTAYKSKNWFFKALEGIVKVDAAAPDMEEAQETTE